MKRSYIRPALLGSCLLVAAFCLAQAACDSDDPIKEPTTDAPDSSTSPGIDGSTTNPDGSTVVDSGGDAAPSDCFMNPTTHLEIINACTNAVRVTKNPVLPKLYPDGGLPPLN